MDTSTREALSTVAETLDRALAHHQRRDEHEAELALARLAAYSPITLALDDALDTVRRLLDAAPTA